MAKMPRVVYRLYVAVEHLADQVGVSASIPDQVRAVRAPVSSPIGNFVIGQTQLGTHLL